MARRQAKRRIVRSAILWSEKFSALSDQAQLLFFRLLHIVDDFGCYDGREPLVASAAWPGGERDVKWVRDALAELHRGDLLCRYTNRGKPFIAIMQWAETDREVRDYPAPPVNNEVPVSGYKENFQRRIGWYNPKGWDQVSILLDVNGREAQPQPHEWRRAPDFMPSDTIAMHKGIPQEGAIPGQSRERIERVETPARAESLRRATAESARARAVRSAVAEPARAEPLRIVERAAAAEPAGASPAHPGSAHPSSLSVLQAPSTPPSLPTSSRSAHLDRTESAAAGTSTPTPTNGKIELTDSGEWHGLSEAQRVRWQDMFADMSIPDQLDRAAAWLLAHPDERTAYHASGDVEAYLIRWLLREARAPKPH